MLNLCISQRNDNGIDIGVVIEIIKSASIRHRFHCHFSLSYVFLSFTFTFSVWLKWLSIILLILLSPRVSLSQKKKSLPRISLWIIYGVFVPERKQSKLFLRILIKFKNTQRVLDVQDFWTECLFSFRENGSKANSLTSSLP